MRYCSGCKLDKDLNDFHNDKNKPLGKSYLCKKCGNDKKRNNELRSMYGITQVQYEELLKAQNGVCKICTRLPKNGRIKKLSVDHCHETGKIRGLLCNNCNNGLGRFKDDLNLLRSAIAYLESNGSF